MYEIINHISEITTEIEPATSLLKDVLTWGEKKFTEKRNKTIEKFYIQLLDGEVTQEKIDYEKEHIEANSEQYYILLNLAINDEEQEKDFIYANVFKYIRDNQQLDKKEKIKLIKIVKQLPYSALELLPSLYIHANFQVKGASLQQLLKDMELTHEYELNLLTQFNILFKPTKSSGKYDSTYFIKHNSIFYIRDLKNFNNLCIAFFTESNLIPSNYNINVWDKRNVLIITDNIFNEDSFGNKIKNILKDLSIQSEIANYKSVQAFNVSDAIFLTDNIEININFKDISKKLEFEQNTKCIKVSNAVNPAIKLEDTIYLNEELDKFKALFSE